MSVSTEVLDALGVPPDATQEEASDARILDAALHLIGEYGEQRLTMDDVAAKAKVGRRTVFRRFGSKDGLLTRVYHREVLKAVEQIGAAADEGVDGVDALAAAFVCLVEYSTSHPVIRRLARAEPETLTELWRTGSPSGHDMALLLLTSVAVQVQLPLTPAQVERACELLAALLFAEQLIPRAHGRLDVRDRATVRALLLAGAHASPDNERSR